MRCGAVNSSCVEYVSGTENFERRPILVRVSWLISRRSGFCRVNLDYACFGDPPGVDFAIDPDCGHPETRQHREAEVYCARSFQGSRFCSRCIWSNQGSIHFMSMHAGAQKPDCDPILDPGQGALALLADGMAIGLTSCRVTTNEHTYICIKDAIRTCQVSSNVFCALRCDQ
jgi:hypothetical protein